MKAETPRADELAPSVTTNARALVALVLLTAATVGLAFSKVTLAIHLLGALTIAATKALLVAVYFMHLRREGRLIRVMALGALLLLGLLVVVVVIDIRNP